MRIELGLRLREERTRLGMNQAEFGELGGVKALAQRNYEAGNRSPDGEYLAALAAKGVDIQYVVTGIRAITPEQLADDVRRMSDAWETLELALVKVKKTLPPAKKRMAAEALFQASKAQVGATRDQLMDLVLKLAA
ncbi:helix-turn-helix domain-containing protein [Bordetella sp. 2513F-2]